MIGLESEANTSFDHVEEGAGIRLPESMLQCIQQIAGTSETASNTSNVEFTTKFAESFIQDSAAKDLPKHSDLATPASWTNFLLSPTKGSQSKDGRQLEAFFSQDHDLHSSQKDIVDLDESTAVVRDAKSSDDSSDKWSIPDDLPIDLRVKTVLCLIELKIPCNIQVSP